MFWYLSFAGEEGWRGAIIVEADSFLEAIAETYRLKINPHGEVRGIECPWYNGEYPMNKLLSKEDLIEPIKWSELDK